MFWSRIVYPFWMSYDLLNMSKTYKITMVNTEMGRVEDRTSLTPISESPESETSKSRGVLKKRKTKLLTETLWE